MAKASNRSNKIPKFIKKLNEILEVTYRNNLEFTILLIGSLA